MKKLTTTLFLSAMLAWPKPGQAQIDQAKMERDLRVASGVLESLIKVDDESFFMRNSVKGSYLEGFGVTFEVEDLESFIGFYGKPNKPVAFAMIENDPNSEPALKDKTVKQQGKKGKGTFKINGSEDEINAMIAKSQMKKDRYKEQLKEAYLIFLVDYSQLIGQLKPTDKVVITTTNNNVKFIFMGRKHGELDAGSSVKISAQMLVKDHRDYLQGKLAKDKLVERIKIVEKTEDDLSPDLEMFSNMLKTTYSPQYTETYFISRQPSYTLMEGLGVVYTVKVYSSYSENDFFKVPGANKSKLSREERDKLVQEMYPDFLDGFKESIIKYGSTIKSLEHGNRLIVKVSMTQCESCTFPRMVEFVVTKEVLGEFLKGNLTLKQAKAKILVK